MASPPSAPNVMLGLTLPDVDVWSDRVTVALGQNPGIFTGPGTNTYLVGTGRRRILLDTGQGKPAYVQVLERALARAGCDGIQEIVLTHGHPDHLGGLRDVLARFGPLRASKRPDEADDVGLAPLTPIDEGSVIRTDGATLRALHTPGHARDHLCFFLEEERALFSGDNVLGVGTTVIPSAGGDLLDYMASLERLLGEAPTRIYPAHGPVIEDGAGKLREYLAHRRTREEQIVGALGAAPTGRGMLVPEIVAAIYTDVPAVLHAAAAHSVAAHLVKLEREGRALREPTGAPGASGPAGTGGALHAPIAARWSLA